MKKWLLGVGSILVLTLGVYVPVLADGPQNVCDDPSVAQELKDAAGCTKPKKGVGQIASDLINVVLGLVGVVAVVVIIYGGFTFMTSSGDTAKVAQGKRILIYGVIGLVVSILASVIVNFVIRSVAG